MMKLVKILREVIWIFSFFIYNVLCLCYVFKVYLGIIWSVYGVILDVFFKLIMK